MLSAISLIALGREGVRIPQNSSNSFGSAVRRTCRADYGQTSCTTLRREPPVLLPYLKFHFLRVIRKDYHFLYLNFSVVISKEYIELDKSM